MMFLVYHVISKSHVIKESNDLRLEHIKVSYHSAKFSGRKHSGINVFWSSCIFMLYNLIIMINMLDEYD